MGGICDLSCRHEHASRESSAIADGVQRVVRAALGSVSLEIGRVGHHGLLFNGFDG